MQSVLKDRTVNERLDVAVPKTQGPTAQRSPRVETLASSHHLTRWQASVCGAKRTLHTTGSDGLNHPWYPIRNVCAEGSRRPADHSNKGDTLSASRPNIAGHPGGIICPAVRRDRAPHPIPPTRCKKTRQANQAGFLIDMPCGLRRSGAIRSSVRT